MRRQWFFCSALFRPFFARVFKKSFLVYDELPPVERRGSAARRAAARRRVVHPVRVVCARQSGSSGAGVTVLEPEPTIKRQRDPPFPRAARSFKCKMTPTHCRRPKFSRASARSTTPARSVNGGRSHAQGEQHNAGSLNRPNPPPSTRTAALSCRSRSAVRLRCAHVPTSRFQLPARACGKWGWGVAETCRNFFVVFEAARAWRSGASSLALGGWGRLRKKKRGFADSRPFWFAYWELGAALLCNWGIWGSFTTRAQQGKKRFSQ